jgi:hypothetical protein
MHFSSHNFYLKKHLGEPAQFKTRFQFERAHQPVRTNPRLSFKHKKLWVMGKIARIDVDINSSDISLPTHNQISCPITRARPRQLNNQVFSFLVSYSSYLDNGNMNSILLLRNNGQEWNRVAFAPVTFGFQNSSSLWWSPRSRMDLDSDAQILSG